MSNIVLVSTVDETLTSSCLMSKLLNVILPCDVASGLNHMQWAQLLD